MAPKPRTRLKRASSSSSESIALSRCSNWPIEVAFKEGNSVAYSVGRAASRQIAKMLRKGRIFIIKFILSHFTRSSFGTQPERAKIEDRFQILPLSTFEREGDRIG